MDNVDYPLPLFALHQSAPDRRQTSQQGEADCHGKMVNPAGVAAALCLGADGCSARGFMFALGCIQPAVYHQNNCPTASHLNPKLQRAIHKTRQRVANFAGSIQEVGLIAHSAGVMNPRSSA